MYEPYIYIEPMRGIAKQSDFVPANHPLRPLRIWLKDAFKNMEVIFMSMYQTDAKNARLEIAPEKLIRALLLQVLYSIRSESILMEQTSYNILFRWFIGLEMNDGVWDRSVFTESRELLMQHNAIVKLFDEVVELAAANGRPSNRHFSVDRTLIHVWTGQKRHTHCS